MPNTEQQQPQDLYPKTDHLPDAGPAISMTSAMVAPHQQFPPPTVIQALPPLGPQPTTVLCPSCHQQQPTRVQAASSTKTHIIALLLCGVCCCCIPYCADSCKNTNHYCSGCGAYLGTYNN